MLGHSGSSAPTRPQSTRGDSLVSTAYQLVKHCETVPAQNGSTPRIDTTATRQLLRWLRKLDLL